MIVECKHCTFCGKTYHYHKSGEHCHDIYNNDAFCPECFKIMIDALEYNRDNITIYTPKYKEVKNNHISYFNDLKPLKDNYTDILLNHSDMVRIINFNRKENYHLEGYFFNHKEYIVQVNDNEPSDNTIFLLSEYNNKINGFTGKPWIHYNNNCNNRFFYVSSCDEILSQFQNIIQKPMDKPTGKLWYADFDIPEWTIDLNNNKNE